MAHRLPPIIGHWYASSDSELTFQVVALDEEHGTVEIQDFEGGLDEIELDDWDALPLEAVEPPEDWSGPVDDVEPDEFGYTDMQAGESEPALSPTWSEVVSDDDTDELAEWSEAARQRRGAYPGSRRSDH